MPSLRSPFRPPHRPRSLPGRRALRDASLLLVLLLPLLAACGTVAPVPDQTRIARIEVTPTSLLMTAAGESHALTARAFDSAGNPVETSFTWTSSDLDAVEVSADGVVTSLGSLGSSQIVVDAEGVESQPVSVVVATPTAGAVLVMDEQILEGPTVLNPELDAVVGTRSHVLLADAPPMEVGTILLAHESAALAGRVVAVSPEGAHQRVEVETVALPELFEAFDFDQTFVLTEASLAHMDLPDDIRIATDDDGKLLVTYAPAAGLSLQSSRFACDGAAAPNVKLQAFTMTFKLDVKATATGSKSAGGDIEQLSFLVAGESSVVAKGGLLLEAGLKGDMTCTLELYDMLLPVSGALSALIAPGLELVGELKVEGAVKAVTVEVGVTGSVGVKVQSGFTYRASASAGNPAGITPVFQVDPILDVSPMYKAPSAYDARIDVGVFVGPALRLQARAVTVGNQSLLSVNLAEGRVGLRGDLSLAHHRPQASDAAYASAYDLKIRGEVGSGDGIQRILTALGLKGEWYEGTKFTFDSPALASSPTGSLSLSRGQALPGDAVEFQVSLSDVTFPFVGDNVNGVQIYWYQEGKQPTLLTTIEPTASNQTKYTHTWSVPAGWSGDYHFVAFTDTVLAPGLPLEVAANSKQTLTVGGVCAPMPGDPTDPGDPSGPGDPSDPTDPADPSGPGGGDCSGSTTYTSHWDYYDALRQWTGDNEVTTSDYEFVLSESSDDTMLIFDLVGVTVQMTGEEKTVADSGLVCEWQYEHNEALRAEPGEAFGTLIVLKEEIPGYAPQWAYTGSGSAAVEVTITSGCDGSRTTYEELRVVSFYTIPFLTDDTVPIVQPGGVLSGTHVFPSMLPVDGTYVHESTWSFTLPGVREE